ncbi:hypothetical protein N9118_09860 [Akkermansiaceae bacterium]|nr:hypothetical protein [Akkermansiaceae bacterium]
MIKKFLKLVTASFGVFGISPSTAHAGVSVFWDFNDVQGNDYGWTTVTGTAWFAGDGVGAGQADGGGIDGYFGGINTTGSTRNAHDGAHVNFLYRSPAINFAAVHETDPVLEFDWFGGAGNQEGVADITNPARVGTGVTTGQGQKGLALLNLTTGDYDAVYYDPTDGNGVESFSLTQADLTGAGVSLTDNYQLDFFENDDGGWGWTRLNEVRLDGAALIDLPFNVNWNFNDGGGGAHNWKIENGFASFSADGVHASQDGTNFAEDAAHAAMLFRSPMIDFSGLDPDQNAIEVNFLGGQGNQGGAPEPAGPDTVVNYNGGNSDANGQKGLAFLNLTTGVYDHVLYDSEDGGDNPESISLTQAELVAAGIDINEVYRLDFFDYDDGASGWTRLESLNLNGSVIADPPPPPPPPSETLLAWNFNDGPGGDNGWTTVNGTAWFAGDGVGAGQADGGGIDGYFGGINTTGSTRNAHDGAHVNFLYRSPMINFATVHPIKPVLEFDWFGGAGNQEGVADLANPTTVGLGKTLTTDVGQKGLALLNLTTGDYDAVYYDPTDGNGVESFSLTQADLVGAGVSLADNYQLDFFENDDGGWGWTRLNEVRIDSTALGELAGRIKITDIDYSPDTNSVTLTWDSREGVIYIVKYSEDMTDWSTDIDDSVIGDAGNQTTRTFNLGGIGIVDQRKVFFRIER